MQKANRKLNALARIIPFMNLNPLATNVPPHIETSQLICKMENLNELSF